MMLPTNPCALLLDLDGTLADSLPVMRQVYDAFLKSYGATGSTEEFDHLNGPPLAEVVGFLASSHHLPGLSESLVRCYHDIADRTYGAVQPTAGARVLLEVAKSVGCTVGLVTSNSSLRAHRWLEGARFSGLVSFVVGAEDVQQGKPHPEPYHLGISRSGCRSERVIAVEDSAKGAASARAAGLYTFALGWRAETQVTSSFKPEACDWPEGVVALESLAKLVTLLWPTAALG